MFFQRAVSVINPLRGLLSTKSTVALAQNTITTKTVEERVGLPRKPKKPLTPYFRYMMEIRPKMLAENKNWSVNELVQNIARQWKAVDEASKKKYEEDYKRDQALYLQKRAQYESKLTEEQRENIQLMKETMAEAKEKRAYRKKIKDLGKPKKPQSPFLKFLNEQKAKNPHTPGSYQEWLSSNSAKWIALSEKQRDTYIQSSHDEMQKYREELIKWEKNMVKLGHVDVVRQEALLDIPPPKSSRKRTAKP
ncbi:transcription factor A, mitochondrial [Phlebotomus argentipes]|uniref:transcription factor A, mitochondrial n=1 Tax=Phlebotomus argentipes TaxID=94469 RepID=UPI00289315D4|nr:transcription factor A, mitochondrial [Phlebotomus argentipes]